MSRCSQGMATVEVYKLNITRWTWELCEVGDVRKSSQLITRLYYNCPALKMLFFCKKSGHSCFYRVTCILSQLLIWKLTLLKNSHLCSRQWYLLHTFLKMTPLPYISEDQRDKFFTPLVRFQGYSQVLDNRCEKFVLPQIKVKAQNTSAVQTENRNKIWREGSYSAPMILCHDKPYIGCCYFILSSHILQ